MARTSNLWKTGVGGTYIQTIGSPNGYDILINGTNHYLNFNTTVGVNGYGIRDNAGVMEFKNSGGSWTPFGSGSGISIGATVTGGTDGSVLFVNSGQLAQDNNGLYYNQSDNRLGINLGTSPSFNLDVNGQVRFDGGSSASNVLQVRGAGDGGNASYGQVEWYNDSTGFKMGALSEDGTGSYGALYMYGDHGLGGGRIFEFFGLDRAVGGDQRRVGIYGQSTASPNPPGADGPWLVGFYVGGASFSMTQDGYIDAPSGFSVGGTQGVTNSGTFLTLNISGGIIIGAS